MAAAEARAAWQRTANRYFVQEDAKRAPKLACCPSASSSSKQVDAEPANAADEHDKSNVGFMPLSRNPPYCNLPSESRWWLQMQPNYGFQKSLTNEQLSTSEIDMEAFRASNLNSTSKASDVHPQIDEHKTVYSQSSQEPLKPSNMLESYQLVGPDPAGCLVSKKENELNFDTVSPWFGGEKTEPWWRMADTEELAFLVAQRSHNLIENCDLPLPQNARVRRDPYAFRGHFGSDGVLPSSRDLKFQTGVISSPTVNTQGKLTLGSACVKQQASAEGRLQCGSDMRNSTDPTHKSMTGTQNSNNDPGKAQLLEALRHSQTRAREAEKAAQQAYAEKEHILKLFFRQASHLFAYKQWFQLLQLENLYFQIKNNDQPISILFPAVLPWMPLKTRELQKSRQKPAKGKRGKRTRPRRDTSKFTVAFALGLGLVGAGLLLGWTVGWMFPTF